MVDREVGAAEPQLDVAPMEEMKDIATGLPFRELKSQDLVLLRQKSTRFVTPSIEPLKELKFLLKSTGQAL
jgi:hypothetical protein